MNTKYNTGDRVLVPGTIVAAKEDTNGIVYEVSTDWLIPESVIQDDRFAIGAQMRALAEAMPRNER